MSNSFWILAGVLVAAAAIISLCERHNRRRKRIRFEHRESATTGQLATFFPSIPRDTVEEALGIISIEAGGTVDANQPAFDPGGVVPRSKTTAACTQSLATDPET